jgi:hypothetical protein
MADEKEYPKRGYDTRDVEAMRAEEPPRRRRHWARNAILIVFVVPFILLAIWTWITLSYTYSRGDRAGYLQKFSEKGWLCKTWEGELTLVNVPGAMPEIFYFSVRDDRVAEQLTKLMGNRVSLTYEEHKGIPTSCFGETDYFVTDVRTIDAPQVAPQTPQFPVPPSPQLPPPAAQQPSPQVLQPTPPIAPPVRPPSAP